MTSITQILDDLPVVRELRDDPDKFVENADKLMTALPPMVIQFNGAVGQINTVIGEINATATAIAASSQSVSASEINATAQAQAAIVAAASAVNAPGTSSISSTSLSLTAGIKNLTVATNKAFPIGASVKLCHTLDVSKWMIGSVISYVAATGAFSVLVDANDINGAGTFGDWAVSIAGHRGAPAVVAPPTPSLPIGALMPMQGASTNPVVLQDGSTWLRTGTIALASAYPSAVNNTYKEPTEFFGLPQLVNGLWICMTAVHVFTSSDLKNWTKTYHNLPVSGGIFYHNGTSYFFASGTSVYTTSDFATFTATAALPSYFSFIVRVNGVLFGFMSSYQTAIYTSTDGTNWTLRTMPTNAPWCDVAWTGSKYVAVAGGVSITATSTDAATWSAGGALPFSGAYNIVSGGGTLVVVNVGGSTTFAYSTDNGMSWASGTFPAMTVMYHNTSAPQIAWTGTKFIVPAYPSGSVSYATSTNGISWTEVSTTAVPSQIGAIFLGSSGIRATTSGRIVGLSGATTYVSYDNAANWSSVNDYGTGIADKVAGSSTKIVQTRAAQAIRLLERATPNSTSFAKRDISLSAAAFSGNSAYVAYSGTAWVVTDAANDKIARSTDGVTWIGISAGHNCGGVAADRIQRIAATPNCFITLPTSGTAARRSTDDGLTWSALTLPASFSSIYAKGSTFIGVMSSGTTYYTSIDNGTTWVTRTAPARLDYYMFDGNYLMTFAATPATASGYSWYSTSDGINWNAYAFPVDSNPSQIASSIVIGTMAQCLMLNYNPSPYMGLVTKDGGATWKFGTASSPYGSDSVQPIWCGYGAGSGWASYLVDYCGQETRQYFYVSSSSYFSGLGTYYQRVA